MIAGNLLQQVYNLTDALIVGKCIGSDALAAVGSAYTLMVFLTSVIIGLCMGSGALFSADLGGGNAAALEKDVCLSFRFILGAALLLSALVYPGRDLILALLQTPPELLDLTRDYVTVVFGGILFVFLYNFFAYLLRSAVDSVTPLLLLAVSSGINIGLDLLFVLGLGMGVKGAAWATVLAQAAAGVGAVLCTLRRHPALYRGIFTGKWDGHRMKVIVLNDLATSVQQSVMNFGILMIQGLVNSFGPAVMAAFAAAVKIDTLAYMPAQEFGNAYSLFVSQNYGAREPERIRRGTRIAFLTSILFCALVSLFICLFAAGLMGLFVPAEETAVIAEGARYLRIEGALYAGIGALFLWYGYFRGVGRPRVSLLLTVLSLGTRVALSYALAPHTPLGVLAIWCSIPIGWLLADGAGLLLYRRDKGR